MSNKQLLLLLKTSVRCPREHTSETANCVLKWKITLEQEEKICFEAYFSAARVASELKQSNVKNSK